MELRTNELFKSYLQETVISKTPPSEPRVDKFRDNLQKSEDNKINKSISSLCTMIETCQIQLHASNEMISKLISPESDFIVIQKKQLKEFLEEFKQEFHEFKDEIKSNLAIESQQKHRKPLNLSQKTLYEDEFTNGPKLFSEKRFHKNDHFKKPSSQRSIFDKPLTPPPSFEAMLESNKFETFSGKLECNQSPYLENEVGQKLPTITQSVSKETPVLTYRINTLNKAPDFKLENLNFKKKRPKLSPQPSSKLRGTSTATRMKNTQSWLDSLPLPPKNELVKPSLNKLLTSSISFKKMRDKGQDGAWDCDTESLGKWSCRSIRTYKKTKTRKRSANFVKIDRAVKSEAGWGKLDEDSFSFERHFRSEY